jgi:drug/metabolite transporter (DMT)-like permease
MAVTVLWSSSWILIRVGLDDEALGPVTFAGLRYGLASTVLVIAVAARRTHRAEVRRLDPGTVLRFGVLGLVVYTITQGAQFVAIDNQPAATTSLVLSLTPLLVAFVSVRQLGERAAPRQLVGAGLVVAGASIYFAGDLGATTVGLAAAAVGLTANVNGATLGRHVNRAASTSPLVVTAVSMTAGALVLVIAGLMIEGPPSVTPRAGVIIAWLAVVNTALAFTLWNFSLRRLSALESAGVNNTMLIQIALLAWLFLDESPGTVGVIGIVAVSLGVFLTRGALPQRPARSGSPVRCDDGPSGPDRPGTAA